jgi:CheY-like chemotaxis protein
VRVVTELRPLACHVEVDRAQLQSAILNIATNARDAMPAGAGGTLTIRTRDVRDAEGKRLVALEIEDNGAGMSAEVQERIFEPFFTTKGMGKGTGLGLSQVYGFAAQSGGEVRVASELGKGTVVTLMLPCVDSGPSEAAAPAEPAVLPPATILVVEDNADVANFAEALLSELGHRVTRAASGEEALEIARRTRFDIVLSDVVMPGMGGLRLADTLAAEQPDLPVVLATGYSQEIAEGGSGGRPVILKPYRLATLSEALSSALRDKPTAA